MQKFVGTGLFKAPRRKLGKVRCCSLCAKTAQLVGLLDETNGQPHMYGYRCGGGDCVRHTVDVWASCQDAARAKWNEENRV